MSCGAAQPLLEARAVVVALKVAQLEREVRHGLRAVADRHESTLTCQTAKPLHGEKLTGRVRDVAKMQDSGARCNCPFEPLVEVVLRRRHRERNLRQRDVLASHPLIPRRQHPGVVLIGRQYLVPRLKVEAVLHDLQPFARIPGEGEFLGVASDLVGKPPPHRLEIASELPAIIERQLVREVEITLEGFVNNPRSGRAVTIVQVRERPVERERELDLPPEGLV